jgi:diphthamide synthase (EF-2-diphthine--ammonia ligase)
MRPCDWPSYEEEFAHGLRELKAHDISHVIFGDLVYRNIANGRATRHPAGLTAVEPLWGQPTLDVVEAFLDSADVR